LLASLLCVCVSYYYIEYCVKCIATNSILVIYLFVWFVLATLTEVNTIIERLNGAGEFPSSDTSEVVIAVPSLFLMHCKATFRPDISTCAEDIGLNAGTGAYTGELSGAMLAGAGVHWALAGHSERRVGFGIPVCLTTSLLPTAISLQLHTYLIPTHKFYYIIIL
jgi:triosephosphate isomerase